MPALQYVVDCYRELSQFAQQPSHSHRRWNAVVDRMMGRLPEVLADPRLLAELREVGRSDADPFVRRYAAGDADPPAPRSLDSVRTWLAHPAIDLFGLVDAARSARVLLEPEGRGADPDEAACYDKWFDSSWLGGSPSGPLPVWPRRTDGIALVHVAQIDLRRGRRTDPPDPPRAATMLPKIGVLQVFHDLQTPGLDRTDGKVGAWLVRWVERPGPPVTPPEDAYGPMRVWKVVEQVGGTTLPCPEDLSDDAEAERCAWARQELIASRRYRREGAEVDIYSLRPDSILLGHGWESEVEARRMLAAAAGEGDWLLLADLSGTGALDMWFGDDGHLELWIRADDLEKLAFDRVWALLRGARSNAHRSPTDAPRLHLIDIMETKRMVERAPVRRNAAADVRPPAPMALDAVRDWLAHPAVGLAGLVEAARPARLLLEQDSQGAELDEDGVPKAADYDAWHDSSWLGGFPSGPLPVWPRRDDGIALVHVAQIDLRPGPRIDPPDASRAATMLPKTGVLQIFYDLETLGFDLVDGDVGGWLVRWVEKPGAPVTPPEDSYGPREVWTVVTQAGGTTLPCPEDLTDDEDERCAWARQDLIAAMQHRGAGEVADNLNQPSILLGHGWESEVESRRMLAAGAGEGDWLLLADLSGTGALDMWFGDMGHLELWIRADDLERRAFDRVWALKR